MLKSVAIIIPQNTKLTTFMVLFQCRVNGFWPWVFNFFNELSFGCMEKTNRYRLLVGCFSFFDFLEVFLYVSESVGVYHEVCNHTAFRSSFPSGSNFISNMAVG